MTLSVTTDFSAGTAIVASEVNQNFTDVETYINSSPGLLPLSGGTLTGALVVGGDLTVDSNTLKVDSSNNRVGIKKDPTTELDVNGTVTATAFAGALTGNVTGNVTGNCSGTAATVTTAAQPNITSVGTLTALTVSGTVTIDSVGITAVQTGSESFADNDTSVMTSAAVQDKIAADVATYGYAKVTIASSAPSAGGAGEIWIDTSS
jgi:hypothetical protein